jgi:hypothetical protein
MVAVVRANYVNSVDASDGLAYVLRTANQTLSLQTTAGFDDVTGLGSPTAGILNLPLTNFNRQLSIFWTRRRTSVTSNPVYN